MALPDFVLLDEGTPIVWKASGGTYALSPASVTNGNGRQGDKGNLGADRAQLYKAKVTASVASAVTDSAGPTIDVYWSASDSATPGTDNAGGATGVDGAYNTLYPDQMIFLGSLRLYNGQGTGVQTQSPFVFSPPSQYGQPVLVNSSGQTLGSTAGNHTFTLTPLVPRISDAITG